MTLNLRSFFLTITFLGFGATFAVGQDKTTPALPGPPAPTESKEQDDSDRDSQKRGGDTYRELSEKTGGLFFDGDFKAAPDDLLGIMLDSSGPDVSRIVSNRGIAQSGVATNVDVQVDASTRYVDFVLNHSTRDVFQFSVLRPDGKGLLPLDADVKLGGTKGLQRVRVTRPVAGVWKVLMEGSGRFQFIANANSSISFSEIHFERLVLGLMHPTVQDVEGELLLNEEVYFDAWLHGHVGDPQLELVTPDGAVLEELTIRPDSFEKRGGTFTPTSLYKEFHVRASGVDASGSKFTRVAPTVFSVRSLVVREDPTRWAQPGEPFRFQIQNAGPPQRLSLRAESTSQIPLKLSREIVDVGTGSTEFLDVELLTARSEIPRREMLFLTAISSSNSEDKASGIMQIGSSER